MRSVGWYLSATGIKPNQLPAKRSANCLKTFIIIYFRLKYVVFFYVGFHRNTNYFTILIVFSMCSHATLNKMHLKTVNKMGYNSPTFPFPIYYYTPSLWRLLYIKCYLSLKFRCGATHWPQGGDNPPIKLFSIQTCTYWSDTPNLKHICGWTIDESHKDNEPCTFKSLLTDFRTNLKNTLQDCLNR